MTVKFRYKIELEYLGRGFYGWQRQKSVISVQQVLEEAIKKFSGQQVSLMAAGRTDAGVHALGQVAHFDLTKKWDSFEVMQAINYHARPHMVGVISCHQVADDFHARFSAIKRHYVYKIINRKSLVIVDSGLKYWLRDKLCVSSMQQAANILIGTHDFTSFRSTECQSKSPIKTLSNITILQNAENIELYFSAPSFLHHMVRNIVGSLVMVGRGIWSVEYIKEILLRRNRNVAGPTAPAHGLYFLKVDY